jgi:hypothetical protein
MSAWEPAFLFCFADTGKRASWNMRQTTPSGEWDSAGVCYFDFREEIMTTLEMSLGGLDGPARRVFRANFGDPVQLGNRKRSNGCEERVVSPPCSCEW